MSFVELGVYTTHSPPFFLKKSSILVVNASEK